VRQIDFKAASNSLKKAILFVYLVALAILLVLETVTVLTGNRSFLTFVIDLVVFNVAVVVLAFLAYNGITRSWKRQFLTASRLLSITDISSDAVYSCDAASLITAWSPGAERVFGYTEEEALGQTIGMILPDDWLERDIEIMEPLLTDGLVIGYRSFSKRKSGEVFPTEASISLLKDMEGDPDGLLLVMRDITERVEMERQLREARDNLEERVRRRTAELNDANEELTHLNRELEAFSYSVSHDLRAPLRAIEGFATMIEEKYSSTLEPDARRLLLVVIDSARRMRELIGALLELSRLGRKEMIVTDVDMEELAREVANSAAESEGSRFEVQICDLPDAECDRPLIRQVLANLVSNAIKFSRDSGSIIEISGEVADGEVVYSVKDNGVGFDMAYHDRMFEVFQRLHSDRFDGTGIGLSNVQRIVRRHGGRVWAHGAVGEGATFYFSLPVSRESDIVDAGAVER